ncbi:MAG: hypothetical protein IJM23_08560 [Lachnospiraceae bacterium]|nr:hypothetical protein [Lachnospiraceae bacterium]
MKLYSQEEQNAIDKALQDDIASHDIDEKEETETLEEEVKLQHEKLKGMTLKEKLSYLFFYYKWHALAAIGIIAFVIYMIVAILSRKDEAFYCVFMNVDHSFVETTGMSADFESYAGINSRKYKTVFDTTIYTQNNNPMFEEDAYDSSVRLNALFMSAQVDVLCSSGKILDDYAVQDILVNLHDFFSEEELHELEEHDLIYYSTGSDGREYPAAVRINDSAVFNDVGIYDETTVVYASVVSNAPHREYFNTFISYLYPEIMEN